VDPHRSAVTAIPHADDLDQSSLLPPLGKIRDCAYDMDIALAVAMYLYGEKLATYRLLPGVTLEEHLTKEQFNPGRPYPSIYEANPLPLSVSRC
jgi:hypothetical protein